LLQKLLHLDSCFSFSFSNVHVHYRAEHNTTIVAASVVIVLTMGGLASLVGRSSSSIFRTMVFDGIPPSSGENGLSWSAFRSMDTLITETASGRATNFLCVVGQVVGVLIISLVWALSINRDRPSKYDGSLCVLLPALLTGFLYFATFFLQLNSPKKVSFSLACSMVKSHVLTA
jgi:hypothetical protein